MSEQVSTPSPETEIPFRVVHLHNQSLVVPTDEPLYDLATTREVSGFNGATVAEIVLPTPVSPANPKEDKRLAIIDFGEDIPPKGKGILYLDGQERSFPTVIHSRYALMSVNYHPEEFLVGYLPLYPGSSHTIGRDQVNRDNHVLGLSEDGNDELSRRHATIAVDESGKISLTDHSTNGTDLRLPPEETKTQSGSAQPGHTRLVGKLLTNQARRSK